MTQRKPPGTSWETWIDAQIRVAAEKGAFDNLPGAGKPLPNLDEAYDPGIAPRSVELWEAGAAVNDVKRPSRFEQQRGCLFPFRSEQQARLVGPEVA